MNFDEAHKKLHPPVPEVVEEPDTGPKAVYRAGWDKKGWITVVKEAVDVGVHLDTAHDDKVVFYDADDATGSYSPYDLTDEDKEATDWHVWGEGPLAEEGETLAEEEAATHVPDVEGGAGEPAPIDEEGPLSEPEVVDEEPVDEYPVVDDVDSYPEDVLEDDGAPVVPIEEPVVEKPEKGKK